jgi:hypothetical protein
MRKIFLLSSLIFVLLLSNNVFGQDDGIVKNPNEELPKLLIKKNALTGKSIYDSLSMQSLNVEQVRRLMDQKDADITKVFNQGINMKTASYVLGTVGGLCAGYAVGSMLASWMLGRGIPAYNYIILGVGAAFLVPGIVVDINGGKKVERAIDMYNNYVAPITDAQNVSLHLGITTNGIGMFLRF